MASSHRLTQWDKLSAEEFVTKSIELAREILPIPNTLNACDGVMLCKKIIVFIEDNNAWDKTWNGQFLVACKLFFTKFHEVVIATVEDPMKGEAANKDLAKFGGHVDWKIVEIIVKGAQKSVASKCLDGQY